MDQGFVVVGGEVEATVFLVLEMCQQCIGQLPGKRQVCHRGVVLHEFEQGGEQEGVVVEIGGQVHASRTRSCEQAAAGFVLAPVVRPQEIQRTARRSLPVVATADACSMRQTFDHQGVPAGQDLVVAARTHTLGARGEEFGAGGFD